ncbi:hypothetical protein [Chitinophaga sp. 212800010-3]|uniref:hypothetical protein n=1 Tax=unclassified Chitinophaga TaxID=2619133 RepID=UPI002DE2D8A6|nr:LPD25 domain-containing protein [Chitinophaga sp. 212800010-3]
MKIYISEEAVVADIQDKFHELYPYLKLEFFREPHADRKCSPQENAVPADTPIEKIRIQHSFGWLDVGNYRTALAIEHDFRHLFGLSVQILRRSGDLWLEVTGTSDWTLEKLNAAGKPDNPEVFSLPDEADSE